MTSTSKIKVYTVCLYGIGPCGIFEGTFDGHDRDAAIAAACRVSQVVSVPHRIEVIEGDYDSDECEIVYAADRAPHQYGV